MLLPRRSTLRKCVVVRLNPEAGPAGDVMPWPERWKVVKQSWGVLLLLLAVIGGIYGGVFTVNEAAALGAMLAFLFTVFRGKFSFRILNEVVREVALNTAMIYVIIAGASIFSFFIADTRMPAALTSAITDANLPPLMVIFVSPAARSALKVRSPTAGGQSMST